MGGRDINLRVAPSRLCILIPLFIGIITPSLIVFVLEITIGHICPLVSLKQIAHRQFASGDNLFLLAIIGLIPFAILSSFLQGMRTKLTTTGLRCVMICGLIGILSFMIPSHISVWKPLYTHEHMSSTAVIAFLFIPIYCTTTMLVGLGIGFGISHFFGWRTANKSEQ
jgi:hypothetical protein